MLVLSRRVDQSLFLFRDDDTQIEIKVCGVIGGKVKIGIKAPSEVRVVREELLRRDVPLKS